ncbi:alpha/beta hydrolase [Rhodococcus sp. UFZ-B548]|uniref:alpha/beta hydrolase n=1 Tax=Rhodococcus sp. UFZ-B548 TaxID=2742212 RepID=UPI002174FFA6|nr:alpha/beta hydrolase [Rhodococcus sp. UFZ-B548]
MPATLVLTTEHEVVREEAKQFAERLKAAGVDCRDVRFDGLVHGVFWGAIPRCQDLHDKISSWLCCTDR